LRVISKLGFLVRGMLYFILIYVKSHFKTPWKASFHSLTVMLQKYILYTTSAYLSKCTSQRLPLPLVISFVDPNPSYLMGCRSTSKQFSTDSFLACEGHPRVFSECTCKLQTIKLPDFVIISRSAEYGHGGFGHRGFHNVGFGHGGGFGFNGGFDHGFGHRGFGHGGFGHGGFGRGGFGFGHGGGFGPFFG